MHCVKIFLIKNVYSSIMCLYANAQPDNFLASVIRDRLEATYISEKYLGAFAAARIL